MLFVDLLGSTELAARLDPEDMGDVIRAYQRCCTEAVERTVAMLRARTEERPADVMYPEVVHLTKLEWRVLTASAVVQWVVMIFGVSLFIRLAQTVFRPSKVHYECPECGLNVGGA